MSRGTAGVLFVFPEGGTRIEFLDKMSVKLCYSVSVCGFLMKCFDISRLDFLCKIIILRVKSQ